MIPVLAGFSRTGSRMGLLALGAGVLLFFIFATALERMAIIMGGVLFLSLALTLLPDRDRGSLHDLLQCGLGGRSGGGFVGRNAQDPVYPKCATESSNTRCSGVGPGEFMDGRGRRGGRGRQTGALALTPTTPTPNFPAKRDYPGWRSSCLRFLAIVQRLVPDTQPLSITRAWDERRCSCRSPC